MQAEAGRKSGREIIGRTPQPTRQILETGDTQQLDPGPSRRVHHVSSFGCEDGIAKRLLGGDGRVPGRLRRSDSTLP